MFVSMLGRMALRPLCCSLLRVSEQGVKCSYPVFVPAFTKTVCQKASLHFTHGNFQQLSGGQEISQDLRITDEAVTKDIISKVNQEIEERSHGRLFAVIHVCGKQFKVTSEDLIVIEGNWAPTLGDRLRLDKVLLVGGSDFTLIGRPTLPPDLVSVEATVIEKRLSHTRTNFKKKRRKQFMRIHFYRSEQTMLRITNIEIKEKVNEKKDVEGLDGRIF